MENNSAVSCLNCITWHVGQSGSDGHLIFIPNVLTCSLPTQNSYWLNQVYWLSKNRGLEYTDLTSKRLHKWFLPINEIIYSTKKMITSVHTSSEWGLEDLARVVQLVDPEILPIHHFPHYSGCKSSWDLWASLSSFWLLLPAPAPEGAMARWSHWFWRSPQCSAVQCSRLVAGGGGGEGSACACGVALKSGATYTCCMEAMLGVCLRLTLLLPVHCVSPACVAQVGPNYLKVRQP